MAVDFPQSGELQYGLSQHKTFYCFLFVTLVLCSWWWWTAKRHIIGTPPMLPYKIPVIGHTASFINNSESLISRGRQHFNNTGQIFSILLAGNMVYVLTDPRDMATVHADATTFTFRSPILETILVSFGISAEGSKRIMNVCGNEEKRGDPKAKSLFQELHDMQVKQTIGAELTAMVQHVAQFFSTRMSPDYVRPKEEPRNGVQCIPLKSWARELQVLAMQDAFLGVSLESLDPNLPSNLLHYSKLSWQTWYHVPKFLRKGEHRYSTDIQQTFERYLKMGVNERGAAWSVESLIEKFQSVGLNERDQSVFLHFFYWGISMNPANLVFWLLAHIVYDKDLMETIRKETAPAFTSNGSVDTYYLVNSCPHLESAWHEVLRLYTSVTSTRYITKDTMINNAHLKKGHAVLFSARQMAFHDTRLGENPLEFDATRFHADLKRKNLDSHRHFGGGKFMCCGRHLTKHVHATFVAQLLRKYDVSLAFPQKFPGVFDNEPSIGVLVAKDDLYLQLKERV